MLVRCCQAELFPPSPKHTHTTPSTHNPTQTTTQGRYIHEATHAIPIIGDGDTGYGNAMNVKRTVRGYAAAGFAGARRPHMICLAQIRSCGHVRIVTG